MKVTYKSKTEELQLHAKDIGDPRVQPKITDATREEDRKSKHDLRKKGK